MNTEVRRHKAAEQCITEACEFLEVDRDLFFDLAEVWGEVGPAVWRQNTPETFYTAWRGDVGKSAVAANVMDQFSRREIWELTWQVFDRLQNAVYLDFGCGTGSVSFPFLEQCMSAVMMDVPNTNQEFLRWRVERRGLRDVAVLEPDALAQLPDESFSFVACVDVLEHLRQPSAVFAELDRAVQRGGLLLFRSPWAREGEDFGEHLPEATVDWQRPGGGDEQLQRRYSTLATMPFGGLYQKQA